MSHRLPPSATDLCGIVVTGASSHIGRVLASSLLRRNVPHLILTTRTGRISDELRNDARVIVREGLDLSSDDGVSALREAIAEHFAGPFGLVHSVGSFWEHQRISATDIREVCEMMSTHYLTLYAVLHKLLPLMAEVGGGRVLALSCTSVQFDHPEMAAFTSAKAAVNTLIKCTANEWAEKGISANAIALSTVATDRVMATKPLALRENYITPEEVCTLIEDILFAVSRYISGNIIRPLKHSHTFYYHAYFDRNPAGPEILRRKKSSDILSRLPMESSEEIGGTDTHFSV